MEFGERLRALRENSIIRLTQKQLAESLNTTQRKISRLETGEAEPSLQDLCLLCRYFNVSADYLLGLPDDLPYPGTKR